MIQKVPMASSIAVADPRAANSLNPIAARDPAIKAVILDFGSNGGISRSDLGI